MGLDTLGEVPGRRRSQEARDEVLRRGRTEFLGDLRRHNDRTWFNEHKERYERALREPFLEFIADAGPELRTISKNLVADPRPSGGSLFRIHRDVRFSKDKSPYKTHAGAHFPLGGRAATDGYYLHLEPGECFVAGGCGCRSRRSSSRSGSGSRTSPLSGRRLTASSITPRRR